MKATVFKSAGISCREDGVVFGSEETDAASAKVPYPTRELVCQVI
jgi:hypothetical protein